MAWPITLSLSLSFFSSYTDLFKKKKQETVVSCFLLPKRSSFSRGQHQYLSVFMSDMYVLILQAKRLSVPPCELCILLRIVSLWTLSHETTMAVNSPWNTQPNNKLLLLWLARQTSKYIPRKDFQAGFAHQDWISVWSVDRNFHVCFYVKSVLEENIYKSIKYNNVIIYELTNQVLTAPQ